MKQSKALLGAHVSYKKDTQLLGALKDLISIGATSGAFYISNSRGYNKHILDEKNVAEAKQLAKENDFDLKNIIVHSPLVGNLANIDQSTGIFEKTLESYYKDLVTLQKSGLKLYNFHPGSAPDINLGISKVAEGINKLIKKTKNDDTILLIETMMPKGNYIGKNLEQISQIINLIKNKDRIGVCLDTCHIWDAGYNLQNINEFLKEFDTVVGLKYLKALHINDSKNALGSGKDRHEAIGKGYIGLEALREVVNHKDLKNLPKALETPYGKDDFKRWKDEIKLLTEF